MTNDLLRAITFELGCICVILLCILFVLAVAARRK